MKVELLIDHYTIKLMIDELIHVYLLRDEFVGFQSWADKKDQYSIEFYTKTNSILTEQDNKDKWLAILRELNKL
jgi:hypothetical protein